MRRAFDIVLLVFSNLAVLRELVITLLICGVDIVK